VSPTASWVWSIGWILFLTGYLVVAHRSRRAPVEPTEAPLTPDHLRVRLESLEERTAALEARTATTLAEARLHPRPAPVVTHVHPALARDTHRPTTQPPEPTTYCQACGETPCVPGCPY
jgi:hypothetical protein